MVGSSRVESSQRRRPGLLSLPLSSSGDDASLRPSPFTTDSYIDHHDHKSAVPLSDSIHPLFKFFLSFACGTLAVMLATSTTTTIQPSPRSSFSLFNTRIEFRSMFIATLFLFLFLCLGQYSHFAKITLFFFSFSVFAFRHPCAHCGSPRLT